MRNAEMRMCLACQTSTLVSEGAKRLECVELAELAPAFEALKGDGKPHALQTLRAIAWASVRGLRAVETAPRSTFVAVTRKRSLTVPLGGMTVEVSHKPSRVAWPSSFWKAQRNRAPSAVAMTASPLPL